MAEEIIAQGGALVAEFEPAFKATTWSFPARNRLMVGASHATLVIEGGPKSGSLISARLAWDYDRELGVVPGEIFATNSYVSYKYMKDGATPITCSDDILELLRLPRRDTGGQEKINFTDNENFKILGEIEKKIIETLQRDRKNKDALVRELVLDPKIANVLLSALEIEGWIKEEDGVMRVA